MSSGKLDLVLEKKSLEKVLNYANSIVEKRNVIGGLGNIKISASDGIFKATVADSSIYLEQFGSAGIFSGGEANLPAKLFSDVIKKIQDKDIRVAADEGAVKLTITGGGSKFDLLTFPPEDFKAPPEVKSDSVFTVKASDLARLIENTYFSASSEEARYNLNGVYLHTSGNELRAVATDGHRLALSRAPLSGVVEKFGAILPSKSASELTKILKDPDNSDLAVEITLSSGRIKFKCGGFVLISKTIDGTFPDYERFLPSDNPHKLTVKARYFGDAVDRASLVAMDKFKTVKITINEEGVFIKASADDKGEALETLKYSGEPENLCDYSSDEKLSIGFNPRYLTEVFNCVKNETAEIFFKDSFSPILVKSGDKDSFVIMPVNI